MQSLKRRSFLKQSTAASAGLLFSALPALGNPFFSDEHARSADDLAGSVLAQRGLVTTYLKSRNELQYIGMPVGGIMCGTVYLGGDGRLWLWDIFNKNQTGVVYKEVKWHEKIQGANAVLRPFDGANYVDPVKDIRPLDQGFAVMIESEGGRIIKRLHNDDWDEIAFEATYPMAKIHYTDNALQVELSVDVFSPFIPLNEDDSGLPATIFSFRFKNNGKSPFKVSIVGWLENKTSIETVTDEQYTRVNIHEHRDGVDTITLKTKNKNWGDDNFYLKADYGDMCIASFNEGTVVNTHATINAQLTTDHFSNEDKREGTARFNERLTGSVGNSVTLTPGQAADLHYAISWYFPNLSFNTLKNDTERFYANKFKSSTEVSQYVKANFQRLASQTALWRDTFYNNSTLPYWFLERTFLNISTLATTTAHRFKSGRFYSWEGVGSCPGTCNHVWQYAQAVARIFPALERNTREGVDLKKGVGFHDDGHIGFRAEYDQQPAMDGQAGRILCIYREHQTSANSEFLKRNWKEIKHAVVYLMKQDTNNDGMVDTQLENTLDAKWPGEIAWLVGLSVAAVNAAGVMAEEAGDVTFANECKEFAQKGKANMEKELFNGEYFIHRPDPKIGKTVLGSYNTCHIDQVYGQSWAFQVGLERVIDRKLTLSALQALWKYNFTKDVGPYLKEHHGGRPYALPGEGGMIMNTNPKNDPNPYGVVNSWQATYFHECMSGFEHQVAAHMMAEGMVDESLQLTRAIHDRYHALKRNPFNEVECSDHYARAMASYGTYVTACGFEYHGPKGYMRFAPKINPDNFSAAFTAAEGWGAYGQKRTGKRFILQLDLKYGSLVLKSFSVAMGMDKVKSVVTTIGAERVPLKFSTAGTDLTIQFAREVKLGVGEALRIIVG